jgi:hypothetical protein
MYHVLENSLTKIAFYISYGKPMAKILVIAAITFQVVKYIGRTDEELPS